MDDLQQRMKNAPKAAGQDRIYIHGEKEYEQVERRSLEGIPLIPRSWPISKRSQSATMLNSGIKHT